MDSQCRGYCNLRKSTNIYVVHKQLVLVPFVNTNHVVNKSNLKVKLMM